MLRQRSRPYLFSNSLAPAIAAPGIAMLDLLETSGELLQQLRENTTYFCAEMVARGFDTPESDHPIVPIMIGDAVEAGAMADRLLTEGIYVRAFSFPVVREGRQESEHKCPPPTRGMILIRQLRHLRRFASRCWALLHWHLN